MNKRSRSILAVGMALLGGAIVVKGEPVSAAFTYQGRLTDEGAPAHGEYDLEFALYDHPVDGNPVGDILGVEDLVVVNGLFTVELDFGPGIFTGQALWLEIGVRPGDSGAGFTRLLPRQQLTATPFATHALSAQEASCLGAPDGDPRDVVCVDDEGDVSVGALDQPSTLHITGDTRLDGRLSINTGQPGHEVLDQAQTHEDSVAYQDADWQSFRAGMDGYLTRVEVLSEPSCYWGDVILTVYDGEGVAGTPIYTSDHYIGTSPPDDVVSFEIQIEGAPYLDAETTYTFQITNADCQVLLKSGNPYPRGRSSFDPNYDLWFRTYMNPEYNPGDVVTVTDDGSVGIGTTDPWSKLTVEDGHLSIRNRLRNLPHHEWVDIDVIDHPLAGLYSVVVADSHWEANQRIYLVLFAASSRGADCLVVGGVAPDPPNPMFAEFRAVADGSEGPFRLQINSPINYPVNVNVSKIQTYP